jgi:hypothetical protein
MTIRIGAGGGSASGIKIGANGFDLPVKVTASEFPWRYRSSSGAGILSVTEILNLSHIRVLPSGIDPKVIRNAGERGTAIHSQIEKYLRNGDMSDDIAFSESSQAAPHLQAWLNWNDLVRLEPIDLEMRIDYEVAGVKYAGTSDFLGRIGAYKKRAKWLIDWKSREVKFGDLHQMVAYKRALIAAGKMSPEDGLAVVEVLKSGVRWIEVPMNRLHKNTSESAAWRLFGAGALIAYHRVEQGDFADEYASSSADEEIDEIE